MKFKNRKIGDNIPENLEINNGVVLGVPVKKPPPCFGRI